MKNYTWLVLAAIVCLLSCRSENNELPSEKKDKLEKKGNGLQAELGLTYNPQSGFFTCIIENKSKEKLSYNYFDLGGSNRKVLPVKFYFKSNKGLLVANHSSLVILEKGFHGPKFKTVAAGSPHVSKFALSDLRFLNTHEGKLAFNTSYTVSASIGVQLGQDFVTIKSKELVLKLKKLPTTPGVENSSSTSRIY